MNLLIRTDDLPSGQRRQMWRHAVCDTLGPLDLRIDPDVPLRGEIKTAALGNLGMADVRTLTPHSVHRTAGLIRRDSAEMYRLVMPVRGVHRIAQGDRATQLGPDAFTLYDFTRPYDLTYESAVRLIVFAFPHTLLPFDTAVISRLTATAIPATRGTGTLLASMLRQIAQDAGGYSPATAARLSSVVLDLVTTALTERLEQVAPPESPTTLLFRIHAFIEEHLADGDLTPAVVAAAHHISLRGLQRLFATEETTVGTWIRRRRLERCRRDLIDPGLAALPVSAVGARWGLTDAAHFSRLFKAAYGVSPSDHRRAGFNPVAASQALGAHGQDRRVAEAAD